MRRVSGAVEPVHYYVGRGALDRLIADPGADVSEIIKQVEWLCDREAHASEYYRENPHLQYKGHPWMQFVASGGAIHLGWPADPTEGR